MGEPDGRRHLVDGALSRPLVTAGDRQGRPPRAADERLGNRRVHRVRAQARVAQRLHQLGRDVLVPELQVRSVGEDLDGVEPVGGDLHQVIPPEPQVVIEVRRYTELQGAHAGSGVTDEHPSIEDHSEIRNAEFGIPESGPNPELGIPSYCGVQQVWNSWDARSPAASAPLCYAGSSSSIRPASSS